jgi:hypothetical protein
MRAAQLAEFVLRHPAADEGTRVEARQVLGGAAQHLTEEEREAARPSPRGPTIEQLAAQMLQASEWSA